MKSLSRAVCLLNLAVHLVTGQEEGANVTVPLRNIRRAGGGSKKTVLTRVKRQNIGGSDLTRPLHMRQLPYFADISVASGCSSTENIRILVDTGSSDFWLDSSLWCNCANKKNTDTSCQYFKNIQGHNDYRLEYDDGFTAKVWPFTADLLYGDGKYVNAQRLENVRLLGAWDLSSQRPEGANGMIGLGYIADQQKLIDTYGKLVPQYKTLPYVLEELKLTQSNAFSMWFKETPVHEEFEAFILFGGYAQNFYHPPLTTFEIKNRFASTKPNPGIVIQLDEILLENTKIFTSCETSLPVLLDTGTFASFLPHDIFIRLVTAVSKRLAPSNSKGAAYHFEENYSRKIAVFDVECDERVMQMSLYFQFGNVRIAVPMSDIIRFPTQEEIKDYKYRKITNAKQCLTHGLVTYPHPEADAISFSMSGPTSFNSPTVERSILGITFLRQAYIVYDLTQGEVALAPVHKDNVSKGKPIEWMFSDIYEEEGRRQQFDESYKPKDGKPESCPLNRNFGYE